MGKDSDLFLKKLYFCRNNSRIVNISRKIVRYLDQFYKRNIVVEQYPMLSYISRKSLMNDGAIGVVYMLHHIAEKNPNGIPTNENLKVSSVFLETIITKYKKLGFDFISLDTLYDIILFDIKPKHPFVSFTIDDGYIDNYTNALPVFEKHHIPFAVFVATDFVDKKALLWWDCVEDIIMTHDRVSTSDGVSYPCQSFQQRWDTFRFLRERILGLDQRNLLEELKRLFSKYDIDWFEPIKKKGMSWEQIRYLANHPLCIIGGHTVSHPALRLLSDDEVRCEIEGSIQKIEEMTQKPVVYFAYPYGTSNEIGEREKKIVEALGLKLGFYAHGGCITSNSFHTQYCLPRLILYE